MNIHAGVVDGELVGAKVSRRLIPFLIACFFVAYLDRVNLGFAALTMNKDLSFSPVVFGWGAGVFFFGYALFEAPSNYILHHVGARRWIARIMVSWGAVSALMALVSSETSFLALRLLLGVTEAGFAPGVILYLTYWIPSARRGRILGLFLLAVPLSTAVGAPISGAILTSMDGLLGLKGWQWLFVIEAAPAIALGVVSYFFLTDRPRDAHWLAPAERAWLQEGIAREEAAHGVDDLAVWPVLRDPRILLLGAAYFGIVLALYGLGMWLPQIAETFGYGPVGAGFVTALPFLCGAVAMAVWGRRSDAVNERVRHTAIAAGVGAAGLAASAYCEGAAPTIALLCVAAAGTLAAMPTFWSFATAKLSGARAAVGIALINSIGNLAGFVGPYLVGWIKQATDDFSPALLALAAGPALCAALIITLGKSQK